MARPRTPTHILEERGAYVHDPQRKAERANEPVPNKPISSTAPKHLELNDDERKIWKEFLKKVPAGVLGDCDEFWLAETYRLEYKARKRTITNTERSHYIIFLGKLGMNPSERSKVAARPVAKEEDEWADVDLPTQTM